MAHAVRPSSPTTLKKQGSGGCLADDLNGTAPLFCLAFSLAFPVSPNLQREARQQIHVGRYEKDHGSVRLSFFSSVRPLRRFHHHLTAPLIRQTPDRGDHEPGNPADTYYYDVISERTQTKPP
jgi:hypothetical protein